MARHPNEVKTAKLFKNGSSQAVRLPSEFRFEGDEVYIWRDDATGTVVLSPHKRATWADFHAARNDMADEDLATFMVERDQPQEQTRLSLTDEGQA